MLVNQSDSQWIAKALLDKDQVAFSRLVEKYQQTVRNYARRLCRHDQAWADDMAQETFITAFEKLATFNHQGSFEGWLLRICYRHFLSALRKKVDTDNIDTIDTPTFTSCPDAEIDIEILLSQLDVNERSAITLQYSFGYSHQEIAEIMALPLGTVKSHITRGKDKLSRWIASSQPLGAAS